MSKRTRKSRRRSIAKRAKIAIGRTLSYWAEIEREAIDLSAAITWE